MMMTRLETTFEMSHNPEDDPSPQTNSVFKKSLHHSDSNKLIQHNET